MRHQKKHVWFLAFDSDDLFITSSVIASFNKVHLDASSFEKRKTLKEQITSLANSSQFKNSEVRCLNILAKKLNIGDYIIKPKDPKILYFDIVRVESEYIFEKNIEYPHYRKITEYKKDVKKEDLPTELYKAISLCLGAESILRTDIIHTQI